MMSDAISLATDWAAGGLLVLGALFFLVAAVGVVKLPDALTRMHAATKAGTLGAGLMLLAASLAAGDVGVSVRGAAIFFFLLITAPIGAHVIGRTVWRRQQE
jgi:multicomponent Na+:H+ antiporter subunit G